MGFAYEMLQFEDWNQRTITTQEKLHVQNVYLYFWDNIILQSSTLFLIMVSPKGGGWPPNPVP